MFMFTNVSSYDRHQCRILSMVGLSCNFDAAYAKTTQFIDSNGALVCGHLYVYISCSVHMYVYLYAFTYFHKYKCVYLYAQICIFFASYHMRLPLYVYIYIYIYIYAYMYIHTLWKCMYFIYIYIYKNQYIVFLSPRPHGTDIYITYDSGGWVGMYPIIIHGSLTA